MFDWLFGRSAEQKYTYRIEELISGNYRIRVHRWGRPTKYFLTLTGNGYHWDSRDSGYRHCVGTKEKALSLIEDYIQVDPNDRTVKE